MSPPPFLEWWSEQIPQISDVQIRTLLHHPSLESWLKIIRMCRNVPTVVIYFIFAGSLEGWKEAANASESTLEARKSCSELECLLLLILLLFFRPVITMVTTVTMKFQTAHTVSYGWSAWQAETQGHLLSGNLSAAKCSPSLLSPIIDTQLCLQALNNSFRGWRWDSERFNWWITAGATALEMVVCGFIHPCLLAHQFPMNTNYVHCSSTFSIFGSWWRRLLIP